MNEDNLKLVYKGEILKKGTKILLEGTDGYATGNHFHITANLGEYYGLLKNSNGSWCYTYDKSLLPNEAFYVDTDYTILLNTAGYKFQNLPEEKVVYVGNPVTRNEDVNQIEVIATQLNCRKEPSLDGEFVGFVNKGIYNYTDTKTVDGYTWYNIGIGWIAYNSSWEILYPKQSISSNEEEMTDHTEPTPPEISVDEESKKLNIFQRIIKFITDIISKFFKN